MSLPLSPNITDNTRLRKQVNLPSSFQYVNDSELYTCMINAFIYFLLFKVLHVSFFPQLIPASHFHPRGQAPTTPVFVSIGHASMHAYKSFA